MSTKFQPNVKIIINAVDYTDRLIKISDISYHSNMDDISSVGEVSVVLDDSDSVLHTLFTTTLLYNKSFEVQMETVTSGGYTTVFKGKVSTPVRHDDGSCTLNVAGVQKANSELVSTLTEAELEDEDCPIPPPPICFGDVIGVRAVSKICVPNCKNTETACTTTTGMTTTGTANVSQINQGRAYIPLSNIQALPSGEITIEIAGVRFRGTKDELTGRFNYSGNSDHNINYPIPYPQINGRWVADDDPDAGNPNAFKVADTSGRYNGNFLVVEYDEDYYYIEDASDSSIRYEADPTNNDGHEIGRAKIIARCSSHIGDKAILEFSAVNALGKPILLGNDNNATIVGCYGQYPLSKGFGNIQGGYPRAWYIPPGSQVYVITTGSDSWVFNGEATNSVYGVYGIYKGNLTLMASDMYTVDLVNSTITLNESRRYGNNWEWGEYYVALKSSIAPTGNVVDVIQYIIEGYTDATIDTTTFTSVKARDSVANYPCGFALTTQPDAFALLKIICFEAHLGLTITNGVAYLKDLSEDFRTTGSISGNAVRGNTVNDSVIQEYSDLTGVYTHFYGKYRVDYFPKSEPVRCFKHNQTALDAGFDRYVLRHDFLIYNQKQCVSRSIDFWLNRYSNIWFEGEMALLYDNLGLKPFDVITINLPRLGTTRGMVMEVNTNSHDDEIATKVWLPSSPSGTNPFPAIFIDPYPNPIMESISGVYELWAEPETNIYRLPGIKLNSNSNLSPTGSFAERVADDSSQSTKIQVKVKSVDFMKGTAVGDAVEAGDNDTVKSSYGSLAEENADYTNIEFSFGKETVEVGDVVMLDYAPNCGIYVEDV